MATHRHGRTTRTFLVGALAVASATAGPGCWGNIGDPGNTASRCGPIPTVPIRRLSHAEYRNSVRDLFPSLDVPQLALVADPQPYGFDNDAAALTASPLLVNQYNVAANLIGERVAARVGELVPCDPAGGSTCGRTFIADLGSRAFRRPLAQAELDELQAVFDRYLGEGFDVAVQLTTQAILQAPQFLYRVETPNPDGTSGPYDIAARLSYLLWATMPDQALFDAASRGELSTPAQIAAQVDRMLTDTRALDGFMNFAHQWVDLARLGRASKDSAGGWSEDVRAALAEEARLFLSEIIFKRGGTVADFLTSSKAFVSAETAGFYGLPAPGGTEFVEVDLPAERRGFLLQAQFLAAHGHSTNASPVLRGLFVLKNLLCVDLGSPPAGVNMTLPAGEEGVATTNRQNYERVTGAALCQSCHGVINPIGFTFENFDTFGRHQTMDNGLPIDASATINGTAVDGALAFVDYLATSEQVRQCVGKRFLTYSLGGAAPARDACLADEVNADFAAASGSLAALMKTLATHPRFLGTAEEK